MAEFKIERKDLENLKGQIIVVTGGSSGIGLATVELLLDLGAYVVVGDQNPLSISNDNLTFVQTNVTVWSDLLGLFQKARDQHGRIDHVFANAGITGRMDYLSETIDPATGEVKEPTTSTFDINLHGMINTAYLGMYHMRDQLKAGQRPEEAGRGWSVVCTASAASFQRFRVTDYTVTKHGILGFMRGVVPNLLAKNLPLRINCISPSWTRTGLVPEGLLESLGYESQGPDVVARSVAVLMADEKRQGQMIYSLGGKYFEAEEEVLLPAAVTIVGDNDEDKVMAKIAASRSNVGFSEGHK